ncbi:MAG: type III secretion system stator protein SctL [Victivallales bacterium]|nr:type III secretion system stator protein SctL [Victivallales bacterium]
MLLLKKNTFELHSPTRLVKAEEAAAVRRAEELLADAEAEAARIREAANEAAAAEKQRGYEQGLEEGKAAIVAKKLELLDESVAFMEAVEGKMVEVVMTALKKCVMEIGDEEMVVQIVRKVMNAVVRNQRHITLKVAPEMVPVVRGRLNEILADYPLMEEIDVQENTRLSGAACMIETEAGIADASVETQLAAIEKSLKKHFSKEE